MLIVQRPQIEEEPVSDNRSRFVVEPLEPGFGYTLGNTLRRTLLSRIPGAAITSVRIEGVQHEFSTIPGVVEDVVDIILNLKGVVLRVEAEEPQTMYLSAKGKGDVTAGDLKVPAGVEVVNDDHHIATLSASGRLEIEMTVERGVGYRSADRNKKSDAIGIIPIDSIFSPGAQGHLHGREHPGRPDDQLRQAGHRHRDRRVDLAEEAISSAGKTLGELMGLFADIGEGSASSWATSSPPSPARPTSTFRSRRSTSPSAPATACAGPRSRRWANWSRRPKRTCSTSPTSARRASKR